MSAVVLLKRLAEEERDRAARLRLEADRLDRRADELEFHANGGAGFRAQSQRPVKLLLSPSEAGQLLGMSRQMVVDLCRRGVLRHGRTDAGYYQIPRQAIRDYVDTMGDTA